MIKYGLISETDARCLEKTIDLICNEFKDEIINITEIGIYGGETGKGIKEYISSKGRYVDFSKGGDFFGGFVPIKSFITGIDSNKDGEEIRYHYDNLIIGNSNEVYNQLEDNSQHLIFEDSCHCYGCVIGSWYHYSPKVRVGGYYAFHDTGKHIDAFKDYQHGDKEKQDSYISVRKGLTDLGLYEGRGGWELVFDVADSENLAGGVTVFKKLF